MLKLSIRDIRIYWFTFLVNLVFWTIMAPAAVQSPDLYLLLPIGFGLLIIIIPLGNDIRDGRDILYASLPIKRSSIVIARYISSFFLASLAFTWLILLGLALERYLPGLNGDLSGSLSFEAVLILFLILALILCIYLPFVLKLGFGAVIPAGIAVTALVIAGFWMGSSYLLSLNTGITGIGAREVGSVFNGLFIGLAKIIRSHGRILVDTAIILVIIITIIISILISINIFSKKEL